MTMPINIYSLIKSFSFNFYTPLLNLILLNISQQLLAAYELGQRRIHVYLFSKIAKVLYVSTDELLGFKNNISKPGPASKIQRRLDQIQDLPKTKQKIVFDLLDSYLQTHRSK